MEHIAQIVVALAVIAGCIVVIKYPAWRGRKRRAEMSALAKKLGWNFEADANQLHNYPHEIFSRTARTAASNTLSGETTLWDRKVQVAMGDFIHFVSGKRGTGQNTFSYLMIQPKLRGVPDLLIRSEGVGDRVAGTMGVNDIDFESAAFSDKFHVTCQDKRFAYDLIHPRMMEFLLNSSPPGVDIEGGRVCISDGKSTWGPRVFEELIPWLREFFDLWPRHLLNVLLEEHEKSR